MAEYILPERKAFVNWFNNEFYKQLVEDRKGQDNFKKIYQELLKEYIDTDTPYRGALVFHGLGTGKTATAITAVEGAASDWEIITMLPASLQSNFVKEIMKFGDDILRIKDEKTKWVFRNWKDISSENQEELRLNYGINAKFINNIASKVYGEGTKDSEDIEDMSDYSDSKGSKGSKGSKVKPSNRIGIFELATEKGEGKKYKELSKKDKEFINRQVLKMIKTKYHFMGYNPGKDLTKVDGEYAEDSDDREKAFYHRLVREGRRGNTPFNRNVIIIDEVHGFISKIVNKLDTKELKRSTQIYDWIMKSESCKLVCLSATPVVNKPSEMAVLINMLKGIQKVYTFKIPELSEKEYNEFYKETRTLFTLNSPVKQFLFQKTKQGELILSLVKNIPNFVSILGADGVVRTVEGTNESTEKDFLFELYDALSETLDNVLESRKKSIIEPDKENITEILRTIKNRKESYFYKEIAPFTVINSNGEEIDCRNNDNFMDTFIDAGYNIRPDRKDLLTRMCYGCVSYYPSSDDVASSDMATKNPVERAFKVKHFEKYKTMENINIVSCPMTHEQFNVYDKERKKETEKMRMTKNGKKIYNYENNKAIMSSGGNSYHIMTRIYGTIAFDEDNKIDKILDDYELLKIYSPKFHMLLENLRNNPEKSLIYSNFIENAGLNNIEYLLNKIGVEYRKVTGSESPEQKQQNIDEYNDNKRIRVMLISEAGAQGISLTNVRQVHIIEPHWNFTRIQQVIGRAIRKDSHKDLPKDSRNVSIYMYVSMFPDEKDPEFLQNVEEGEQNLLANRVSSLKISDNEQTMDMYLMSIMETKHKITEQCKEILISASMDCKQHAKRVKGITCLDFPKELKEEDMYFPGLMTSQLGLLNPKQLKIEGLKKGNYYVVDAKNKTGTQDYILYFNVKGKSIRNITPKDLDKPIAVLSYDTGRALLENKTCLYDPPTDFECLGNVVIIPADELVKIQDKELPTYQELLNYNDSEQSIVGFKVVYKNGKEYLATKDLSNELENRESINRLYSWPECEEKGFDYSGLPEYSYKNKLIVRV